MLFYNREVVMNRIVNILNQSKVFFFATTDGNQPRVRPYNATVELLDNLFQQLLNAPE